MQLSSLSLPFLSGGGETGALIQTYNWTDSPLGSPDCWPPSLRTIVNFLLKSKFPMFLAWGDELTCVYNDAYAEILGAKHPAALGQPFKEVWFEIWDDIYPLIQSALAGEAVFHENLPFTMLRRGFQEQTWFTFSYSPVQDESGAVQGMAVTCIETTGQVLAERHRAEENQRLHTLFQQAPGIMAVVREPDHVFELVNDAYLQLVGYRTLIGKPLRVALPELEGQGYFELLDRVFATGEPYVGRALPAKLQRRPGAQLEERFVDFVYQPIKDIHDNVTGIFIEGSDVTDTVMALGKLRESETRLLQLANTIPHLAWMANPDGHVHWHNDQWYKFTGKTLEEVQGWNWQYVYAPADVPIMLERWKTSVHTGVPYEVTVSMRGASGEFRTFSIRAAPLRNAAGEIVQWFGTNTDITELQRAQDELKTANQRKDEFLAMLAHELRNPLAPISTAAELLKLSGLDEERIRLTSDVIARQVDHMTELVDDLLDVSRVTRGLITLEKETVDLKAVLTDAVEQAHSLIEVKRQHLQIDTTSESAFVLGDRTRLTQVFANIVNNAAKYTAENGHINVQLHIQQQYAEISVIDDGIGIAPALLPNIFDLFTQAERSPDRAQGGLGLGLALVKSLVELHEGTVSAYSEGLGKGSQFTVRLPILESKVMHMPQHSSNSPVMNASESLRVLIVDDNVDAATTLGLLIEALGHKVSVAHSAKDAIEMATRERPQVLFLDIGLPEIDGYKLARRLRTSPETGKSVFVAVTGYGQDRDKEEAKSAGFDHHLVKPVSMPAITSILSGRG